MCTNKYMKGKSFYVT